MKLSIKPIDLRFVSEENGKPCHKHILNGQEVPGCSSIASMFDKRDWLAPWAAKMMHEALKRGMPADEAKLAWRENRDRAADTGTRLHKHMEVYIKERLNGRAPAEAAPSLIADAKDFPLQVLQFLDWEKQSVSEWLAAELQVGSEKHKYAGILDALYVDKKGDICLDDIKTSEKTKEEWLPQLVGLMFATEEMGQEVNNIGILHLPRGGKFKRIPMVCDYKMEYEAFLVAKNFYSIRNLFEARHKKPYYYRQKEGK